MNQSRLTFILNVIPEIYGEVDRNVTNTFIPQFSHKQLQSNERHDSEKEQKQNQNITQQLQGTEKRVYHRTETYNTNPYKCIVLTSNAPNQ